MSDTRTCNKLRAVNWSTSTGGDGLVLDRGMLAKVDRRLFAEMDRSSGSQMVRVPVSDALWSAWRRYCELLEVSMGEAIGALIAAELRSLVETEGRTVSEMVEEISQKAMERSEALDRGQRQLDAHAEALNRRERALRAREQGLQRVSRPGSPPPARVSVGRNEPCPCGSGLKYKRCHGRAE